MPREKVTLVICDGLGVSPEVRGNAFANAQTPTFDYLLTNYPAIRLLAAGTEVGLDMGEPGNSEVGHLTLGTGQIVPQAFQIINGAIKSETYRTNKAFGRALARLRQQPKQTLHLVGLIASGGVHGHLSHLLALLKLAHESGVQRVAVHAITDGRDTPPKIVLEEVAPLLDALRQFPFGAIATVGGRFWAMDRDHHWDRTDAFYWATLGKGRQTAPTLKEAVLQGYGRGEGDENLQPTMIVNPQGQPVSPLADGDSVIFTNYRPDRIRQLAERVITTPLTFLVVTMTDYFLGLPPATARDKTAVLTAYSLPQPPNPLAAVLAQHRRSQLHLAETEKAAHVTYFFNGHREKKYPLEQWLILPSVRVVSFDWVPEMSAVPLTQAYLQAKVNHPPDFSVINFANCDMVAHTGSYEATLLAVTTVDHQLKAIVDYVEKGNEWLFVTADHGNCEEMIDPVTQAVDKEHTANPVPFIAIHPKLRLERQMSKLQLAVLSEIGMLADIAPTILAVMGIAKPSEMAGTSLLSQL